jgi:hypothetical protein
VQIKLQKDSCVRELETPAQGHTIRIPRKNWRKTIEEEAEIMGKTWREIQATAGHSPVAFLGRGPIVQSGVTGN